MRTSAVDHDVSDKLAITSDDRYLFAKGSWFQAAEKMGAHPAHEGGQDGFRFAVWAPRAKSVRVTGDFADWDAEYFFLDQIGGGIWAGFVPGVQVGSLYKYVVETRSGELLWKADPYAFEAECPPGTASRLSDGASAYRWGDGAWLKARRADHFKEPLNIYEVHLGSWKRHPKGDEGPEDAMRGACLTYRELADELVPYAKEMGYTHLELMPVMEHPFDGSWGYQVTGYYAPTSRYGSPEDFKAFVDAAHTAGLGVILDWVPGGFCADAHGLASFDGEMLYESEVHPNWGTMKFDYARGEVRSFLISNILYWVGEYHADGVRMDGVTSMLYLNFGVDDPSKKKFNERGTEEDLVAIDFVRELNEVVGERYPDVMMMAEESTAWPLVTYPPKDGGLGFHFKWDMGWMNDTLHYMQTDFPFRPGNHSLITFSIMYAFNENFLLPLSHDEVVHGKCSLITRMPGDYWREFAGLRTLVFYQLSHPGGKLSFMGNELAPFIEWRYYEALQWFLADDFEAHRKHREFVKAANNFYLEQPAFWQRGYQADGFEWIDADDSDQSIATFVRRGDDPADDLVVLINFDPASYEDFRLGVPREGDWAEVFNSDEERFGGSGVINTTPRPSEEVPWNGQKQSVQLRVGGLCGIVLKRIGPSSWVSPADEAEEVYWAQNPASPQAVDALAAEQAQEGLDRAESERAEARKKAAATKVAATKAASKRGTKATTAKKRPASRASAPKPEPAAPKAAPAAKPAKPEPAASDPTSSSARAAVGDTDTGTETDEKAVKAAAQPRAGARGHSAATPPSTNARHGTKRSGASRSRKGKGRGKRS